jgi:hypothetical protein
VHVWLQRFEQGTDRRLGKDDHIVHTPQRGDELSAMSGGKYRPALPFQPSNRLVIVDRHDEAICLGGGGLQVANVADVQQVEAPVGERQAPAGSAVGANTFEQLVAGKDLTH